jgi:hypothetical protein
LGGGGRGKKWGLPRVAWVHTAAAQARLKLGAAPLWGLSIPSSPLPALPPFRKDPGPTDDRGIVRPPQKPPLASRRRGNWHRGHRSRK